MSGNHRFIESISLLNDTIPSKEHGLEQPVMAPFNLKEKIEKKLKVCKMYGEGD